MARTTSSVLVLMGAVQAVLAGATAARAEDRAHVVLNSSNVSLTQTSNTPWTLTKTGSTGATAVTWVAQATPGASTWGLLIYNGLFTVDNKGTAAATIGNIVVNLQTRSGSKWVTRSSVVADATQDDAAIHANVSPKGSSEGRTSFDENVASGRLLFTDAATNSAFALVPQVTIPPGATTTLVFTASFDNTVLNLPVGTSTRAEILVSFGNAKAGAMSSPNVDINGNGLVDPDEGWVQSVADRPPATVPAETPGNETVTLSDSVSDITTTGTVTFSNPLITLDQTTHSGTVVVNYDGGANGGTITNCAHLTGSGQTQLVAGGAGDTALFPNILSVDLTTCDTQVIGPHTCSPGLPGCGWANGDMITYGQDSWGGDPTSSAAAALLVNYFDTVYPFGFVEVGIPGAAGFSMIFTSASYVLGYLPASGPPGPLSFDLLDPTSTSSGVFGGHVLALQLDVDFSNAGRLSGTSGLLLKDLRLCGLTTTPGFNGMTIEQFLRARNTALGGGAEPYSYDDIFFITNEVSKAFEGGAPSVFAQQHLFNGACPP